MIRKPTIAVVGLGAFGAAAAYQLQLQGAHVIGLDQFTPPHAHGSTHGDTRITRFAVMEGEEYVRAAQRSVQIFEDLQRRSVARLFNKNGFLMIASKDADDATVHGQEAPLRKTIEIAQKFNIRHQILDAAQVRARFPGYTPNNDEYAYYEPESGTLYPEACVAAQLEEARRLGADLRLGVKVGDVTFAGVTVIGELQAQ